MTSPDGLKHIVLHLARCKEFPNGSTAHGYSLRAPLTEDGHIDAEAWKRQREHCVVRRFWAGQPDEHGFLVHKPGGPGGATWAFDYDLDSSEDDEPGYRLGQHRFVPGEYVSIRGADGQMHTYVVAKVEG
ncbi:MAG: hypothetical protein RMK64_05410 [Rhodovarius sp.]|nr:hypothetical protein [Rhodovarius sp.]MCX7931603.1 hypothetical protein [Rhodovarius sp.]MDW8314390.1 hypothetical protein [Rhodovarius sp.]